MPNSFFKFKEFVVHHERCAMKVTTDSCLFGAWVSAALEHSKTKGVLLDIGAGTGLLSLMIAQKNAMKIDAVEIDEATVIQARENIANSSWSNQIQIFHADVKTWNTNTEYNCIVSNPPFYETALRSGSQKKNIAHHDAGLKLDELFVFIAGHLAADGSFFLLLPMSREREAGDLLTRHQLFIQQKLHVKQTVNHTPFRLMIQGSRKRRDDSIAAEEIVIKDERGQYTAAFIALLKDYYLYL